MKLINLSVVIVNFNTKSKLQQCLLSLISPGINRQIQTEIFVIDNHSADGSAAMVKKEFPSVIIIENSKNVGFSAANNQGINLSKGSLILLLNSDTRISTDTLQLLFQKLQADRRLGCIGPKLLNPDKTIQSSTGFVPDIIKVIAWMFFLDDIPGISTLIKPYHIENESFYETEHNVGWVSGACLMVKKSVIREAGLLDEGLFMYGEEVEWCYRMKKKGYRICYTPVTSIIHDKGGSSNAGSDAGIEYEFNFIRYFFRKYKPIWEQKLITAVLFMGAWLRYIIFGIINKYPARKAIYAKILHLDRS